MKVISIGTDRNIFKEGSAVRARVVEYGTLFDEIHVVVFTRKSQKYLPQKISSNVWIYPTNSIFRIFYITNAVRVAQEIIKKFGINNENSVITSEDPFACGIVAMRLKKKTNIPIHIQIHTDFLSPYYIKESLINNWRVSVARRVLGVADTIRVVSLRIKESIKNAKIKCVEPHILPIFVDVSGLQNKNIDKNLRNLYPQFKFIILMASRLTKEKNLPLAFKVLKQVILKYPKTGLIVVGDGSEKKFLQNLVFKMNLSKNVIFESWQTDLVSYYKTAHLFLLTSKYEGYGMTIIEALASGCPTISTDVGIAREVLTDGDVFVCPVDDMSCLAKKIISYIENNALRETFMEEAEIRLKKITFESKEFFLQQYKNSIESAFSKHE